MLKSIHVPKFAPEFQPKCNTIDGSFPSNASSFEGSFPPNASSFQGSFSPNASSYRSSFEAYDLPNSSNRGTNERTTNLHSHSLSPDGG